MSKELTSRNCRGWALANAPVLGSMLIIFFNAGFPKYNSPITWVVLFVLFLCSLFLLRRTFLKWSDVELDFFSAAEHQEP
ncbi:MAG: hypothetical protein KAW12_27050 [Candidatus Aminicenantes bacterium]|nr:hypothetical protein [Candidatus Aminicenantes bacterium]